MSTKMRMEITLHRVQVQVALLVIVATTMCASA